MTPDYYFEKAKHALHLAANIPLDDAYAFGDDAATADQLAALVLAGTKTATASGFDVYGPNDQKPFVGKYDVIMNSREEPVCLTITDSVRVVPYLDVDAEHARREGEGDCTLASWREVHAAFFKRDYAQAGLKFDPQTAQILLETFHVVYPLLSK